MGAKIQKKVHPPLKGTDFFVVIYEIISYFTAIFFPPIMKIPF